VRQYIANAKTAEARESVGRMAKDSSIAYEREQLSGLTVPLGSSSAIIRRLCGSASMPVPNSAASIEGKKYQSDPKDWDDDATSLFKGFSCLRFSMTDPQYFQYAYSVTGITGIVGEEFSAEAHGDLNGDGVLSTFALVGKIQNSGSGVVLSVAPNIAETNPND
jgi:type IV pilus assembly protein PilA